MRTMTVVRRHRNWAALLLVAPVTVLALLSPHAAVSEASGCTNATIAGAYGLTATGAIFAANGGKSDIALVGRTLYDGQGGLSGIQIDSIDGALERDTLAGTYTVRPDCSGSETFTFSPSGEVVHADFVVVEQSHAILYIDTDPGIMLTVTGTRH